jgi:uncharacterized delta-60 repeat protein
MRSICDRKNDSFFFAMVVVGAVVLNQVPEPARAAPGNGVVLTDFGANEVGSSVALQPDRKIVVAGAASRNSSGIGTIALVRYNQDGSADTSFGSGGIVTAALTSEARDLALQPNGKIVVVGQSRTSFDVAMHFAVVRCNPDGSLDATFGTGGTVTTDLGVAHSVELQAEGKIVVAGTIDGDFALMRYNPDGSVDDTFGTDGKVITDLVDNRLALQPDGKILVAGSSSNGTDSDFALARYNPDGSLDASFGGGNLEFALTFKPFVDLFEPLVVPLVADASFKTPPITIREVPPDDALFGGLHALLESIQTFGQVIREGVEQHGILPTLDGVCRLRLVGEFADSICFPVQVGKPIVETITELLVNPIVHIFEGSFSGPQFIRRSIATG